MIKFYTKVRDNLDDCLLRKAIKETPPYPYSVLRIVIEVEEKGETYMYNTMGQIIGRKPRVILKRVSIIAPDRDNCNTWANRVLKKYDELCQSK